MASMIVRLVVNIVSFWSVAALCIVSDGFIG